MIGRKPTSWIRLSEANAGCLPIMMQGPKANYTLFGDLVTAK